MPDASWCALPRAATVVALLLILAFPAGAMGADRSPLYDTELVSRAAGGGFPNGPSRNAVISQDARRARAIAFESDASNIVAGDANGMTDVFVIDRAGGGDTGSPWRGGPTRLASRGINGPANGRSYAPAVDGDASSSGPLEETAPSCVAFISEASNLVPGDTNGKPDAFVFVLKTGAVARISVGADGRQSDGATYDVAVDGDCERAAFTSDATNLTQAAQPRPPAPAPRSAGDENHPNYRSAATDAPPPRVKQVYVKIMQAKRPGDRGRVGLTFLASASDAGVPGDKDSYDPSWSLRTDQVLAFTSAATNLDPGRDANGFADVYVNAMTRSLDTSVRVVSVNASGQAGNGPSTEGAASDQSCSVVFATQATDILEGDDGPTSDIARADIRSFLRSKGVLRRDPDGCRKIAGTAASRADSVRVTPVARGNGPSTQPEAAGGGDYVVFASDATGFPGVVPTLGDGNGVGDAFLWSGRRDVVRLQSAKASRYGINRQLALPSTNPYPSQRINYILFETRDPFADQAFVEARKPEWLRNIGEVLGAARGIAAFNQVYMRYLGPKDAEAAR